LENTLFWTHSREPRFDYSSKIADLDKHHVRFDSDVFNILRVYGADAEEVEYCKPKQIQRLAN
jgi:serine/threonine protein kinase